MKKLPYQPKLIDNLCPQSVRDNIELKAKIGARDEWLRNQERCMEICTGYEESDCCGAKIIFHDICSDCKEHCGTQCDDCTLREKCQSNK